LLKLIPKSWFSWTFTVLEESHVVADIDISWWREKGILTVAGTSYDVYREGLMSGDFILESAGSVLARAQKPSAFRRCFVIEHASRRYTLRAESAFKRSFVLLLDDKEVGSITPEGCFTRRAIADLPQDMLLPMKIFTIWLAVILWKRESDAGGAVAAS
jgi:hypothetical protein